MNFLELVKARYSARKYANRPVEAEKLDYIMECVRFAPSAVNFQPWRFRIVTDEAVLKALYSCYKREWLATAPCIIVACVDHNESWHRRADNKDHADIDIAIAVEHLCLAAAEQGLGTCWVCNFDAPQSVLDAIGLYRQDSDRVGNFIADNMEQSSDSASTTNVFSAYKTWCESSGLRPGREQDFKKEMERHGISVGRPRINGKQVTSYLGWVLRQP